MGQNGMVYVVDYRGEWISSPLQFVRFLSVYPFMLYQSIWVAYTLYALALPNTIFFKQFAMRYLILFGCETDFIVDQPWKLTTR